MKDQTAQGWIDDVQDGIVWGRVMIDGSEYEFSVPLLSVEEGQRVDLQPGRYVSIVNGALLLHKTIWTTHDMEQADAEAAQRWKTLEWDSVHQHKKREG